MLIQCTKLGSDALNFPPVHHPYIYGLTQMHYNLAVHIATGVIMSVAETETKTERES